jgi:hypothetical protein
MEEIITDVPVYFGSIYLLIFITIFILLIRQHFIKGIYHFKLLQILFPIQMKDIPSYWSYLMISIITKLDISTLIWFWFPIYYEKIPERELPENGLNYHNKLKRGNRLLFIYILMFFIIMIVGWFIFDRFGEIV